MSHLQDFYANLATPSYLYANRQKKTNISLEFYHVGCNLVMYYVDKEGVYKNDPLYVNLRGVFYPMTCVDNPLLSSGVYIETLDDSTRTEHYKISYYNAITVLDWPLGFLVKRSELRKHASCQDYTYATIRHYHELSHRIISVEEIQRFEVMTDWLLRQVQENEQKTKLIDRLNGFNTELKGIIDQGNYQRTPVYRSEPEHQFSMGFKEAAGIATTALTLVKLGLSVGKQMH